MDLEPWRGRIAGRQVLIGGTSYGQNLPVQSMREAEDSLVVWVTHHDLALSGFERYVRGSDRVPMNALPGVDIAVNGHYHRRHESFVVLEQTHWFNPGNISRVRRDERDHSPAVLRIDLRAPKWEYSWVPVPHLPFGQVCTDRNPPENDEELKAEFISGLVQLVSRPGGAAMDLEEHLYEYSSSSRPEVKEELWTEVQEELRSLLREVRGHGSP